MEPGDVGGRDRLKPSPHKYEDFEPLARRLLTTKPAVIEAVNECEAGNSPSDRGNGIRFISGDKFSREREERKGTDVVRIVRQFRRIL